jgi:hypothetical protein
MCVYVCVCYSVYVCVFAYAAPSLSHIRPSSPSLGQDHGHTVPHRWEALRSAPLTREEEKEEKEEECLGLGDGAQRASRAGRRGRGRLVRACSHTQRMRRMLRATAMRRGSCG